MSTTPKNSHFLTCRALLLAPWWPKPNKNLQGICVYVQTTPPPSFVPIAPILTNLKRQNSSKGKNPIKTYKTPVSMSKLPLQVLFQLHITPILTTLKHQKPLKTAKMTIFQRFALYCSPPDGQNPIKTYKAPASMSKPPLLQVLCQLHPFRLL